jgi:hypothetical protein
MNIPILSFLFTVFPKDIDLSVPRKKCEQKRLETNIPMTGHFSLILYFLGYSS